MRVPEVGIGRIEGVEGLRAALQAAIELEHATIPPYLTALHSIKPGANGDVARILRSVVVEEMSHMALACNLLNAVGGEPAIDRPGFVPRYPGPLPMSIGSADDAPLVVPLAPLSRRLVHDVFMRIEEPETPVERSWHPEHPPPHCRTIGDLYEALKHEIRRHGEALFTGDPGRQLVHGFRHATLIAVTDVESAVRAIDRILSEGEGSASSPLDTEGEPAHYYRFAEICYGRRLVADATLPDGFSFTGAPVALDEGGIWPMVADPRLTAYAHDPPVLAAARDVNAVYSRVLHELHRTFAGEPDRVDAAVDAMFVLETRLRDLVAMPVAGTDRTAGPTFELVPEA